MLEPVERKRITRGPAWLTGDSIWLVLALGAFLAQQLAIALLARDGIDLLLRRFIFLSTTGALLLIVWPFRRYVGAWAIGLGVLLNFIPMAAHGGFMPISYQVAQESGLFPALTESDIGRHLDRSKDIIERENDIRFAFLTDRYVATVPVYGTNVYSLGDFVLFGGVALAAAQVVAGPAIASLVRRRRRPPLPEASTAI